MSILDNINNPNDLKKLEQSRLPLLCSEIREFIVNTVAETGGHLASSLGSVELITALHYIFNTPNDKIVFDVGHQAYAHKILTERKNQFHTLRQFNGLSGFLRPDESIYDNFISGHSSTAISAALGIAAGRDLSLQSYKVISVIGDGTLTGGMSFEALNNAGHFIKNFLIILNDNEMAISQSVGAIAKYLNKIITSPLYNRLKKDMESAIKKIPNLGPHVFNIAKRFEESLKGMIVPGLLFEELGFRYFGPVDGHNINHLIENLKAIKDIEQPILLHVITQKGKGYKYAEEAPVTFHGTSPFNVQNGNDRKNSTIPSYTEVFSNTLCKLAKTNKNIVAITAAMAQGTGLDRFKELYPKRFFDVGIAEQHAVTFAAGLATNGYKPVVAIYSTFLQRSYDQIITDICLQKLPVIFAIDRAGLVGEDGPTHHGVFDISYLRHIPNMVIMQPKDENELQHMLNTAVNYNGPIAIRYPRGTGIGVPLDTQFQNIEIGKSELFSEGTDGIIIALGSMFDTARQTIRLLRKEGIQLGLVNARFIKPIDKNLLYELRDNYPVIITMEEHVLAGGFGSAVLETIESAVTCLRIGIPDAFVPHGKTEILRENLGFTPTSLTQRIKEFIYNKSASSSPILP